MLHLQHNIVGILYTIKGVSESHLAQVEEGRFRDIESRVLHAEEALMKIARQAEEGRQITRRLGLALKANQDPIDRKASLQEAWHKTYELLKREFSVEGIEFIDRVPEDFPLLQCDPAGFQEIIYHLAKNSLQAMGAQGATNALAPAGGQAAGKFIVRAQISPGPEDGDHGIIAVADTGGGISREALGRLFRPFFTTKPADQGNGLGLYLTREIVRKNQGKITVSSFEGYGTTFILEFPLARQNVLKAAAC